MSDYDSDIVEWSDHQVALLRRRAAGQLINDADLDWPNLAEEIESLGTSERSKLASHVATVLEHLIKLQASPATHPRRVWIDTIYRTRISMERVLRYSPSLRRTVASVVAEELPHAAILAARSLESFGEQPRVDIASLTYTEQQVIGDWFPDDDPA